MRLPGGERPLRSAGNSSAVATSLKAEFLSRIGRWASAVVPPLGSLFGVRLARTCEKAGVPIPVKLQCQRCASVLEPGVNCSLRESDRTKGKAVYVCDYCSYRNSKGSVKKKKNKEAPSTSAKSTPDSSRKKKRKGWSSLKDLAVKDNEPALKRMSLTMDTTGTGTGEVVDNGRANVVEFTVGGDKSGEADFKLSALRKVVDMDARISEVEGESIVPSPAVTAVEDKKPAEPDQPQVVSLIMEALPEAVEVAPVTVTLSSKAAVEEEEDTVSKAVNTEAEKTEPPEKPEKPETVVLILDDDVVEQRVAETEVQTTARVDVDDEKENSCAPLKEPEQDPVNVSEEAIIMLTNDVLEAHEMESGKDQEMVAVDNEGVLASEQSEQRVDIESERLDHDKEAESKDEEMVDVKGSETVNVDAEVAERHESEHLPEARESEEHVEKVFDDDHLPSTEPEDTLREIASRSERAFHGPNVARLENHLRRHGRSALFTLKSVIKDARHARKIRSARFTSYLGVLRRHCKKLDVHWRKKLEKLAKQASMEKERADKAIEALNASRNLETTLTRKLSCVPDLEKKMNRVSDRVDGLCAKLTQKLNKQWAAVSKLARLAHEPKHQPILHDEERQPMVHGEQEQPTVQCEQQLTNAEATTTTQAKAEEPNAPRAREGNVNERTGRLGVSTLSKLIKKKPIKKKPFCSPFNGSLALKKTGRRWRLTRLKI